MIVLTVLALGVLITLALGVFVWQWMLPSKTFLSQFAMLLTDPTVTRDAFGFFSVRQVATGLFEGRQVAVDLQLSSDSNPATW